MDKLLMIPELIEQTKEYMRLVNEGSPIDKYLKTILMLLEGIDKSNI
jgi:hypothetical protein